MTGAAHFLEPPRLQWHHNRPFALARLQPDYARELEALALRLEPQITSLPVSSGWESVSAENPTTARYKSYNTFLLDPRFMPLFLALRDTYRFMLQATGARAPSSYVKSWFNVHRAGQNLRRHHHKAGFIGSFAAHAEGSVTRYGGTMAPSDRDYAVDHIDGGLLVTVGHQHFHDVSTWQDPTRARVTYAFDIVGEQDWRPDRLLIPFHAASDTSQAPTAAPALRFG